jgi:hypothetical protein
MAGLSGVFYTEISPMTRTAGHYASVDHRDTQAEYRYVLLPSRHLARPQAEKETVALANITGTSGVGVEIMGVGIAEVFAKASDEVTTPEVAKRSGQARGLGGDARSSSRRAASMVSSPRVDWHPQCDTGKETPSCTRRSC